MKSALGVYFSQLTSQTCVEGMEVVNDNARTRYSRPRMIQINSSPSLRVSRWDSSGRLAVAPVDGTEETGLMVPSRNGRSSCSISSTSSNGQITPFDSPNSREERGLESGACRKRRVSTTESNRSNQCSMSRCNSDPSIMFHERRSEGTDLSSQFPFIPMFPPTNEEQADDDMNVGLFLDD